MHSKIGGDNGSIIDSISVYYSEIFLFILKDNKIELHPHFSMYFIIKAIFSLNVEIPFKYVCWLAALMFIHL